MNFSPQPLLSLLDIKKLLLQDELCFIITYLLYKCILIVTV
jgi:hypothetical protein